jgi:hypothetical protein
MQLLRIEPGERKVWTWVQFGSGMMMSMFLVLPPLFWGVAAFNPGRAPEITALMHELSLLTLTTTDQYYIWQMVAITYLSFVTKPDPLSPFPRWIGYLTIWAAIMFEVGALAFNFKTGVFSWAGLFVFWFPFCIFGIWNTTLTFSMLSAIKRQAAAGLE